MKLPIAETFHSVQGEGTFVGTPMHFIRLAGCSVGRAPSPMLRTNAKNTEPFVVLPSGSYAWACQTFDGRLFWCDTDFNKHAEHETEVLITETWEKHICLTGGEPLIHLSKLDDLFFAASGDGIRIHIETSGTIDFPRERWPSAWLTVAPKYGFLDVMIAKADEIKLLVDPKFHPSVIPAIIRGHRNVFLCPVNDAVEVRKENVERCLFWLREFPNWRLSAQWHKLLDLR